MDYALYQYKSSLGSTLHALVNTKTKDIYIAMPSHYSGVLYWYKTKLVNKSIWETIQADKHHKVVATAVSANYITPRS